MNNHLDPGGTDFIDQQMRVGRTGQNHPDAEFVAQPDRGQQVVMTATRRRTNGLTDSCTKSKTDARDGAPEEH